MLYTGVKLTFDPASRGNIIFKPKRPFILPNYWSQGFERQKLLEIKGCNSSLGHI